MNRVIRTFVFPVKDLAKAKAIYSKLLATEPTTDSPYYVGYRLDEQEIGLDPNGHRAGLTSAVGYWDVADIQDTVQSLIKAGCQVHQPPKDVGGGMQIAILKDADGNPVGLRQNP